MQQHPDAFLLRLAEFVQNDEIGRANSDATFDHFSRFCERAGVNSTALGQITAVL